MTDQPVCIRRVNTLEEAQLLVAWLDDYEIDATVVGAQNPGSLAFGISDFEGIGVVAQEPILFSTSLADNIRYGSDGATPASVEAAARAAHAHPPRWSGLRRVKPAGSA